MLTVDCNNWQLAKKEAPKTKETDQKYQIHIYGNVTKAGKNSKSSEVISEFVLQIMKV